MDAVDTIVQPDPPASTGRRNRQTKTVTDFRIELEASRTIFMPGKYLSLSLCLSLASIALSFCTPCFYDLSNNTVNL